jgi:hypothetical protein
MDPVMAVRRPQGKKPALRAPNIARRTFDVRPTVRASGRAAAAAVKLAKLSSQTPLKPKRGRAFFTVSSLERRRTTVGKKIGKREVRERGLEARLAKAEANRRGTKGWSAWSNVLFGARHFTKKFWEYRIQRLNTKIDANREVIESLMEYSKKLTRQYNKVWKEAKRRANEQKDRYVSQQERALAYMERHSDKIKRRLEKSAERLALPKEIGPDGKITDTLTKSGKAIQRRVRKAVSTIPRLTPEQMVEFESIFLLLRREIARGKYPEAIAYAEALANIA